MNGTVITIMCDSSEERKQLMDLSLNYVRDMPHRPEIEVGMNDDTIQFKRMDTGAIAHLEFVVGVPDLTELASHAIMSPGLWELIYASQLDSLLSL